MLKSQINLYMNNITFIIHLRKDNEERVKNANIIIPYFRKVVPGCKFIIVEDGVVQHFEYLSLPDDTTYIHFKNKGQHNKCMGYNLGLKASVTDIVCFLDIDCLISDANIKKSIETALSTDAICIGYNGVCIYFNYEAKSQLTTNQDAIYQFLESFIDKTNLYTSYTNEYYHVANTRAVGGALFGKRQTFINIGGFNPNFRGWGFEDNEIIIRAKKLNIPVFYINTNAPYLLHLPHISKELKNKESSHVSYKLNEQEYTRIVNLSKIELVETIKLWKNSL